MQSKSACLALAAALVVLINGCTTSPNASIAEEDKGGPLNVFKVFSREGHEVAYLKDAVPGSKGVALVPGLVWEGVTISRNGERCTAVAEKKFRAGRRDRSKPVETI